MLKKLIPDSFVAALLVTMVVASVLPVSGRAAGVFEIITNVAVGVLFFLHGAKLSREAVIAGVGHWRLHVLVFLCTFAMFPVLGLALKPVLSWMMTPELYLGFLFLCALPSTVQSSIALTAIARGNVPAAVCSASASSLLGIFVTPLLAGLLVMPHDGGGVSFDSALKIMVQLLLPFIAGHLLRPWIGEWVGKHRGTLKYVDQGSILLVVYTAFSAAVIEGLWHDTPMRALIGMIVASSVLLAIVLFITSRVARRMGFSQADQITVVFCGSKKSLATGAPMAKVLFASSTVGAILLPVMIFHQIQLMVCAVLAQRYGRRPPDPEEIAAATPARP